MRDQLPISALYTLSPAAHNAAGQVRWNGRLPSSGPRPAVRPSPSLFTNCSVVSVLSHAILQTNHPSALVRVTWSMSLTFVVMSATETQWRRSQFPAHCQSGTDRFNDCHTPTPQNCPQRVKSRAFCHRGRVENWSEGSMVILSPWNGPTYAGPTGPALVLSPT